MKDFDKDELEDKGEAKQKKKKFNLFDWYYRQGKASDKEDVNYLKQPTIANFFKLLWKRLGKLISANLIMTFGNFPIIFVLIAMSNVFSEISVSPLYQAWGPIYGAATFGTTPTTSALLGAFGAHAEVSVINTPTIVFYCLGALIIFTWGFTKVATTYLYRNMMSGDAVFPFSDSLYVIKRNVRQSLIFGIIDALIIVMFAYNIYFLFINYNANDLNSFMLFLTIAMVIFYSFARHYAYIMIFTFDLKLTKIIKNALFFTILGIKRNLVALVGTFLVIALNYFIFMVFMPLGILFPFVITLAICDLMAVYAAYPNIIKYMMDERDAQAIIEKKPLDDYDDLNEDDDEEPNAEEDEIATSTTEQ
ncbi:MAG: hypothetical protein IJX02_00295 [Clostridia bacterium]|nr:hypothetical protein [Clostridia bacterium]